MRNYLTLNEGWQFSKEAPKNFVEVSETAYSVDLPHTWNKYDGTDGGSDYQRGTFYYTIDVPTFEMKQGSRVYIEFKGANSSADIYVNGTKAGRHEGGYSTFRFDITDLLNKQLGADNIITAAVDNSANHIYPQTADFTFYGGLYRGVDLIVVEDTHFDLDYLSGPGFAMDSKILNENNDAKVNVTTYVTNPKKINRVEVTIYDEEGNIAATQTKPAKETTSFEFDLKNAHLWNGVKDPYLYTVVYRVMEDNETVDEVSGRLGIREFHVDPQKGFFLNGILTPLRGVSRHQDRASKGNALDYEDHLEDALLIKELGANTIRLAHYQHAQEFYDLCDELGLIVWAEIPFISAEIAGENAFENAKEQMRELIVQNYNHPSIVTWGISNEITIGGENEGLYKHLCELNDIVHEMDKTRVSTMAQVSPLPMTSNHNQLTDILSYNHYFGWYGGTVEDNDGWFDTFHANYPERALGISEYGCEGNISFHSDKPCRGDYSEEYQALYHEHMAKMIDERPWLWATHIWNMFDFGADNRDEGGVKGRNNKGLITFDRKTKKDSYFVYQAYWSETPMIHIASKRFRNRATDTINIKVYTNQNAPVVLLRDGEEVASLPAAKVVEFKDIALHDGENHFTVQCGNLTDRAVFEKVAEPEESYIYVDENPGGVTNWFDDLNLDEVEAVTINPDFYSLEDTFGDILKNEEATLVLSNGLSSLANMNMKPAMLGMFATKKFSDLATMMTGFGGQAPDPKVLEGKINYINSQLQKIKK